MPNPLDYDADEDFRNASMTTVNRTVQALTDEEDEALVDHYIDWVIDNQPEALRRLLIQPAEAVDILEAYAAALEEEEADNDLSAQMHRFEDA
ncbi:hypothetical protein [Vreelandella jeotgali]|uniref:hypothetical protein n=1 Tax=Vreelandella jeotgali TaxID=553386 RepID=UPI000347973C|nr:hypothetical protein [Halomonas jeotgali]